MRKSKASHAFTLVELLVVVGIIAVLVGLLLPTLAKARQAAKSAMCLANMRTFANAAANFEAQNKGGLILDLPTLLLRPNTNTVLDGRIAICPALADYVGDLQNYSNTHVGTSTYAWNPWIGSINALISPGYFHPSSVRDGAEVALLGDAIGLTTSGTGIDINAAPGLQDPFFEGANYWPNKPAAIPALCAPAFHGRHNGRGAVLWVDGHATMALAVPAPTNSQVRNVSNVAKPSSNYTKYQIGYLVRSQSDLNTIGCLYYFVSNKNALSQNDINAFLKLYTTNYPASYAVNPAAW